MPVSTEDGTAIDAALYVVCAAAGVAQSGQKWRGFFAGDPPCPKFVLTGWGRECGARSRRPRSRRPSCQRRSGLLQRSQQRRWTKAADAGPTSQSGRPASGARTRRGNPRRATPLVSCPNLPRTERPHSRHACCHAPPNPLVQVNLRLLSHNPRLTQVRPRTQAHESRVREASGAAALADAPGRIRARHPWPRCRCLGPRAEFTACCVLRRCSRLASPRLSF